MEVEVMDDAGIEHFLVPYNSVGRTKLMRLGQRVRIQVTADSLPTVEGLSAAVSASGVEFGVLVDS